MPYLRQAYHNRRNRNRKPPQVPPPWALGIIPLILDHKVEDLKGHVIPVLRRRKHTYDPRSIVADALLA